MSEDGRAIAVGVQLYSPKLTQPDWHSTRFLHVRVFEYSRGYWNQLGDDIDGKVTDAHFGYSVAMSGDGRTLFAGEPVNVKNGRHGSYSGQARVFEFSSGSWKQLGTDINGQGDFGARVAMSKDGSKIVVGGSVVSEHGVTVARTAAGHVRVFEYVSGTWNQLGDTIYGEAAFDAFRSSVAISKDGKTIVGGSLQYGPHIRDSGNARVFEYSSETWNQLGGVIDGEAAGDMFGASVSMSVDGRTIVVAAVQDSWERSWNWNWICSSEGSNDMFGTSVAMSEDGRTIVAGALKKGDGNNAGQVRVFTRPTDIKVEADIEVAERPTDIEVGESSGFIGAITVGVLILFAGAAYFLWKRTLKPRTKTDHGSTELIPISLAVPVDGHGID
eukprot:scaffold375_cov299-Chaetoceros_neogracile.AAC.19